MEICPRNWAVWALMEDRIIVWTGKVDEGDTSVSVVGQN